MKTVFSFLSYVFCGACLILASCTCRLPENTLKSLAPAPLFPNYEDGTHIPYNIAPLNFTLPDTIKTAWVTIYSSSERKTFKTGQNVTFSQKFWRGLVSTARQGKQDTIRLEITVRGSSQTYVSYPPVHWIICPEPIDPFLTYRLLPSIEGAYNTSKRGYNVIELRERNLENFEERILLSNEKMQRNCFNCHTSPSDNPQKMLVHLRNPSEGSLFFEGENVTKRVPPSWEKIGKDLPDSLRMPLNFVYPAWHPQEEWIAFSTNILGLGGYTPEHQYVDILDSACNIILYNVPNNEIVLNKTLWTTDYEETWPAWSPDGKWLYFCRAPKTSLDTVALYPEWGERILHINFDLCRIAFNAETGQFFDTVQTLLHAEPSCSYSMPRVQPDGQGILLCQSHFNSIPYHSLGNLLYLRLDTLSSDSVFNERNPADVLNSIESESWHDWSRNGRWVVFGSKRQDGHYELPYIAYFDGRTFSKPFLLPQKSGKFYKTNLRLFNLPTFARETSQITSNKAAAGKESPSMAIGIYPKFL